MKYDVKSQMLETTMMLRRQRNAELGQLVFFGYLLIFPITY